MAPSQGVVPFKYNRSADYVSPAMSEKIRRLVDEKRVDILEFDFFRTAGLARTDSDVPQIYVEIEIPHVRLLRQLRTVKTLLEKWRCLKDAFVARREERRIYQRFDSIVALSEADRSAILRIDPGLTVDVSPFGIDTEYLRPTGHREAAPQLLFVGGDGHPPNIDALCHFGFAIFPLIREQLPEITISVAGSWTADSRLLVDTAMGEGVRWLGFVPDLRPHIERAVLISPIRIGSGLRVKILEAMAMAVPVVSTRIGCEGIPVTSGEHLLLGDTPREFARMVVEACTNAPLRRRLGDNARRLVEEKFSVAVTVQQRQEILQRAVRKRAVAGTA
ncbi:MAG: glycosyltransferase family 4 protein [Chloroflexi bacterium]|nr:glycosyltransferase family 4 protein [Chloroflexota bacterium]